MKMKMKTTILVLSLICLTVSCSTVSQEPKRRCVLDPDGKMNCVEGGVSPVSPVVRVGGKTPCKRKDVRCWCEMAKKYTNDVRKKNGVKKMLKLGTQSQMNNAMKYAKTLGGMGFLRHQDLTKVTREVGCQRWIGGENLAFNYESGNIAKMCVDQWVGSRGHFENLVRDWFEEVVVGFHFMPDGRVYCVQTFALQYPQEAFGSPKDRGCQPVVRGTSPTPRRPAPAPKPKTAPKRRAPKRKAPEAQKPKPETKKMTAPPSCKCIRYGKGCGKSIAQEARHGCISRTQRSKQRRSCKMNCCGFCKAYPGVGYCSHRHVKRICRNL